MTLNRDIGVIHIVNNTRYHTCIIKIGVGRQLKIHKKRVYLVLVATSQTVMTTWNN